MNTRAFAAQVVHRVITQGLTIDVALEQKHFNQCEARDKKLIYQLCFGTIRWYFQIKPLCERLLHKPLPNKHHDIFCILLVGCYELTHLCTPPYAVIDSAVRAVKCTPKKWAAALVNKILRRVADEHNSQTWYQDQPPQEKYALPGWLIEKISTDWPDDCDQVFLACNHPAPLTIRINPRTTTTNNYQSQLDDCGISSQKVDHLPHALLIEDAVSPHSLPGFLEGDYYIQDQAGQYATQLLDLKPGYRVLDACAAPGSKTTAILAEQPLLKKLTAVEINAPRAQKILENLQRLQLDSSHFELKITDVNKTNQWWDGLLFDRILLDAPCSATGVMRRHPDIKIHRNREQIKTYPPMQYALLHHLWPTLAPGGVLVYATCSILKDENHAVIEKFLKNTDNATLVPLHTASGFSAPALWQLLPTLGSHDGFFYARLQKIIQ